MIDIFELIRRKCPDGVPRVAIKDLSKFEHGVGLDKSMLRSEGDIPVIHYGEIYTTYNLKTNKTVSFLDAGTSVSVSAHHGDVVVCLTETANLGFVGKAVAQICGVDVAISGDAGVLHLNPDKADAVFVSHIMNTEWFQIQKEKCKRGTTVMHLAVSLWQKIKIPLPPLQIQREIVAILDKFDAYCNDMTTGLAGELEMRRKQYRYWAEELLSNPAYQQVKAGSLFTRVRTKAKDALGGKVCSMTKDYGLIDKRDFEAMGRRARTSDDTLNYLAIPCRAFCYDPTHLDIVTINWNKCDVPCYVSPIFSGFSIDETKLMPEFLELWLHTDMFSRQREQFTEKGARVKFDYSNWNRIFMPLPDLQEQARLVGILAKFRELERELELRRKQYGYYRDMLLSFPEKKGA